RAPRAHLERRAPAALRLRRLPRLPWPPRCGAAAPGRSRAGRAHRLGRGAALRQVALVLLLAGCVVGHRAGARGNPDDALHELDVAEIAAQRDPALQARAGWYRYLIASDPAGAERHFQADGASPLALLGMAEIAEDRTETLAAV